MYTAAKTYLPAEERSPTAALLTWICWLEPLWLAVMAIPVTLPGLLPATWQPYVVLGLLAFWPLQWLKARQAGSTYRFGHWSMLLLLGWLPINLLTAVNGTTAWATTGYVLLGVAFYVAVNNHSTLKRRPMYFGWLLMILTLALLIGAPPLVQWKSNFRLFYVPVYDWFQLLSINIGETIHANILAGALVQLLALSVALALPPKVRTLRLPPTITPAVDTVVDEEREQNKHIRVRYHRSDHWRQWRAGILALLTLMLLLLTQSRGAYLAAGVVMLMLVIWRWPRLSYGLPLLALVGAYALYQFGAWSIFDLLGADNTFGGAEWRTEVWYAAGQALHDFPYTGIGIGNFRTVLPLLYPNAAVTHEAATHAHNLLLQIGLDLGLPGLIAWLLLIGGAMWQGIARLRRPLQISALFEHNHQESSRRLHRRLVRHVRQQNEALALTAGALAAIVGILVHGMLDAVTWGTKLAFLPWLMLAIIQLTTTEQQQP